jgi:hypothetical protein
MDKNHYGEEQMRNKMKHNKIRNTGLLYEFLLRQCTSDVLSNKKGNVAVKMIKKRFSEHTELGKEFALYNVLVNKKFKDDKKADYFINEVLKQRHNINLTKLKREKFNLVKEINETYDSSKFFSSKVPNYKIYASVYRLFEFTSRLSPDDKTEIHFNLVEHITTNNKSIKLSETFGSTKLPKDEEIRILAYKTLLEKFNNKYKSLNGPQKSLLRAYINNVSNTSSLREFIEKVKPALKAELKKYSKNLKDKVVRIKMNEAIKRIDKFCITSKPSVNDSTVIQTMRYMELLKELKKSGKRK